MPFGPVIRHSSQNTEMPVNVDVLGLFRLGDSCSGPCDEGGDEIHWQRRQSDATKAKKRQPSNGREQGHRAQRKRCSYLHVSSMVLLGITLETVEMQTNCITSGKST